jgi:hypothetical protein
MVESQHTCYSFSSLMSTRAAHSAKSLEHARNANPGIILLTRHRGPCVLRSRRIILFCLFVL